MESNKKGFTLIELLAVIVILAIIALIATPIILNVIDTARRGAAESSALGYIDAIEKQVMINEIDTSAPTFTLDAVYNAAGIKAYGAEVKGDQPSDDSLVKIGTKGDVVDAIIIVNGYKVFYNNKTSGDVRGAKATATNVDSIDGYNSIPTDSVISAKPVVNP